MTFILADTSVWADHFRSTDAVMAGWLSQKRVRMHPFVIGELAMGGLPMREQTLTELNAIHQARLASDEEVMRLVEAGKHYGTGLGWIDVHLLASVLITHDIMLWTRDRRLNDAAARYGRAARLHH